jgi:hypothetical protein
MVAVEAKFILQSNSGGLVAVVTLLDHFMPIFHFNEVHAIVVRANASRVFNAIEDATPAEAPLFRLLLGARSFPRMVDGRKATRFRNSETILDWATRVGFVLLGEQSDRELVLGWVGQFWKLVGGSSPRITNPEQFLRFNRPDYAKATLNFCLAALPHHTGVRLTTETRVYATDPIARKKFAAYWRLIRGGSGLIRREWLRAIRRRAEWQQTPPR